MQREEEIAAAETEELLKVKLLVNGSERNVVVEPRETLLDTLRDKIGLTGPKKGCNEAVCGACAVLLNGRGVCSCSMFAVEAEGCDVVTIEGLSGESEGDGTNQELDPIQKAFIENDGLQCGFCTAGQIIAVKSFLLSLGLAQIKHGSSSGSSSHSSPTWPRTKQHAADAAEYAKGPVVRERKDGASRIEEYSGDYEEEDEEEMIKEALSGNLCRCGCYNGIVAAVKTVMNQTRVDGGA